MCNYACFPCIEKVNIGLQCICVYYQGQFRRKERIGRTKKLQMWTTVVKLQVQLVILDSQYSSSCLNDVELIQQNIRHSAPGSSPLLCRRQETMFNILIKILPLLVLKLSELSVPLPLLLVTVWVHHQLHHAELHHVLLLLLAPT